MDKKPNLVILVEDHTENLTLKKLLGNLYLELNFNECLKCAKNLNKTFGGIGLKIVYSDNGFTSQFSWQEKHIGTLAVEVLEKDSILAINKFAGPTTGSSSFSAGLLFYKLMAEIKPLVLEEAGRYAILYSQVGG